MNYFLEVGLFWYYTMIWWVIIPVSLIFTAIFLFLVGGFCIIVYHRILRSIQKWSG